MECKELGVKQDAEKPPLALLSTFALLETGKVLQYGAAKYGPDNWRKGLAWRRLTSAALRHILAFNEGEDLDPETSLSHLAHAMCMIMFVLESTQTHPELDDRWRGDQGSGVRPESPPPLVSAEEGTEGASGVGRIVEVTGTFDSGPKLGARGKIGVEGHGWSEVQFDTSFKASPRGVWVFYSLPGKADGITANFV